MKTLTNKKPNLKLLIGGVAVILLSSSGIAAVMAWMPASINMAGGVFVHDKPSLPKPSLPSARSVGAEAQALPGRPNRNSRVKVKCPECGVVASTRKIEQLGTGIHPVTTGGVKRGGRIEMPRKTTKSYEVTVRMKDGSSRVFMDATSANWRPGERVILIEGASQSND